MGVEGNEAVDVLAKQALRSGKVDVVVSMSKAEAKSLSDGGEMVGAVE